LDTQSWDPDEDRFELSPITLAVRDRAIEAFQLWQRWQVASFAGTAPALDDDAPRVLPEDRVRYDELLAEISPYMRIDPARRILIRGAFEGRAPAGRPLSGLMVRWMSA